MKCFQELKDTYLNNKIISDEIYDGEPVKDMTDCATRITAVNYYEYELEKVAVTCNHCDK